MARYPRSKTPAEAAIQEQQKQEEAVNREKQIIRDMARNYRTLVQHGADYEIRHAHGAIIADYVCRNELTVAAAAQLFVEEFWSNGEEMSLSEAQLPTGNY